MTLDEVRKKILEAHDPEWFQNITVQFKITLENFNEELKGFGVIYEFVDRNANGWEEAESQGKNVSNIFGQSIQFFRNLKIELISFLNDNLESTENELNNQWTGRSLKSRLNNNTAKTITSYNSPLTEFLLSLRIESQDAYNAAIAYLSGQVSNNLTLTKNNQFLKGTLLAHSFKYGGAFSKEKKEEFTAEYIEEFSAKLSGKLSDAETQIGDFYAQNKIKLNESIEDLDDDLLASKDRIKQLEAKFVALDKETRDKMNALSITYNSLLRLKEPVKYWNARANDLRSYGKKYLKSLYAVIGIVCAMLFSLLWLTPEEMLLSFFDEDKSAAIRWSIIFITLLSFSVIGIRAAMRITFSYFHLARDAEEKEQLTYVYLALEHENAVKDDLDRQLILQSLFSRADTGLLKDDSSPTMPSSDFILKNIKFNK